MKKIKRVLISVYDKRGIVAFANELAKENIEILSSGGTASLLKNEGLAVKKVEDYTGFPEIMNGRVKTLHPKIHGAILCKRDNEEHLKQAKSLEIDLIDMVVVNLYPFKETVEKGSSLETIIENIDIGGPSMVRSAAKNYKDVVIVTSPDDYWKIVEEMKENDGVVSLKTRFYLASKAFSHTALYDGYISSYFSKINERGEEINDFPETLSMQFTKKDILRYGENPHQKAVFYEDSNAPSGTLAKAKQLHGKKLSFNNYIDLEAAKNIVFDFEEPAISIMKHTNPCGAAIGKTLKEAFEKAHSTDTLSAFGSIVGSNREIDEETAKLISKMFVEAVIAPSFSEKSLEILQKKKNIRLIELGMPFIDKENDFEFKKVSGGLLVETADRFLLSEDDFQVVTETKPTKEQLKALLFAQKMVKHVKSNAIVLANNSETIGIGAGQMSRIDALEIAIKKANKEIKGSVMASDAFFPFRDSVDRAVKEGIVAIIQPGGSIRDTEVIDACNEHKIPMIFTGTRNFRHL